MRSLAILILALAVMAAPLIWRLTEGWPGPSADREAGALEETRARLEIMEEELRDLADRVDAMETAARIRDEGLDAVAALPEEEGSTFGGFDELMLLSARDEMNKGLHLVAISDLVETFGVPAPDLNDQCVEPTSERLLAVLETRDVGPFRAKMVRPALDSLERIMARVEAEYPALYKQLRTYGGFCVRLIRGSNEAISRHAFGLAIDVSIGGSLDAMGDGKTQFGLLILRDYFYEEGWIWGAAFSREDSMHFEISAELFAQWKEQGLI